MQTRAKPDTHTAPITNMNGVRVKRLQSDPKGPVTILIPLPRALWRDADTCCCEHCTDDRSRPGPAYWDTLAVAADKGHTWMVHMPELHK